MRLFGVGLTLRLELTIRLLFTRIMGLQKINIKWKISQLPRKYEENTVEIRLSGAGQAN
jgi:hypothetical protein